MTSCIALHNWIISKGEGLDFYPTSTDYLIVPPPEENELQRRATDNLSSITSKSDYKSLRRDVVAHMSTQQQ